MARRIEAHVLIDTHQTLEVEIGTPYSPELSLNDFPASVISLQKTLGNFFIEASNRFAEVKTEGYLRVVYVPWAPSMRELYERSNTKINTSGLNAVPVFDNAPSSTLAALAEDWLLRAERTAITECQPDWQYHGPAEIRFKFTAV